MDCRELGRLSVVTRIETLQINILAGACCNSNAVYGRPVVVGIGTRFAKVTVPVKGHSVHIASKRF